MQPTGNEELNAISAVATAEPEDRPLRIAIVVETFARDMGYLNNTLPKYLARLGHDVHLVTSDLLPYFQLGSAASLYGSEFAERNKPRLGSETIDGFTVHTLPNVRSLGYPRLQGLQAKLDAIAPDVVCAFTAVGWIALDCAIGARRRGYRLVIGSHTGKTAFPSDQQGLPWYATRRIRNFATRTMPGWFIGATADHCVVPTRDCAEVASEHFGIPRSIVRVANLPVDRDFFYPAQSPGDDQERAALRTALGFHAHETVCVYSGKFTEGKNPVVLLRAIEMLAAQGQAVRGLFIGSGAQRDALMGNPLAVVVPFMSQAPLGRHYRAADLGVWMEESISFLDAASCGLPLVLGSTVKDLSHLDGFTSTYASNDARSLADAIRPLLDPTRRRAAGQAAARLSLDRFAASRYASQRVEWFRAALRSPKARAA
jgi:glycosyltransferase involved in cell wall biosynthesis